MTRKGCLFRSLAFLFVCNLVLIYTNKQRLFSASLDLDRDSPPLPPSPPPPMESLTLRNAVRGIPYGGYATPDIPEEPFRFLPGEAELTDVYRLYRRWRTTRGFSWDPVGRANSTYFAGSRGKDALRAVLYKLLSGRNASIVVHGGSCSAGGGGVGEENVYIELLGTFLNEVPRD